MNLKEGNKDYPIIDKSQKEMEREIIKLKAQIEVLQNKAVPPSFMQKNNPPENTERVSVEALKKFEDQFNKLITPLRDDMRKIT